MQAVSSLRRLRSSARAHHNGTDRKLRCPFVGHRAANRDSSWISSRAAETADDFLKREPGDLDAFARRAAAGDDSDCIFLKVEGFSQQRLERTIRAPVFRRRLNPDLQGAPEPAYNLVLGGARHDLYGDNR